MSSRLFQSVREELGLAYSVYSFHSFYEQSGVSGVYVGTGHATADAAYNTINQELSRLAKEGLPDDDLAQAKQQLKGQVTLGLESPSSRMYRAAGVVLHGRPYKTVDALLAQIDGVETDEVAAVTAEFFEPERQTCVWLGPN